MTPLGQRIVARIRASGPMSLAEYMTECLLHPEFGYYTTQSPLGAQGDFVTAPEISQMFGELLGLSLAQAWIDQGRPDQFVLAELGPGRGTLMADLLRAGGKVPGFIDAARIHLVEASPRLRQAQAEALQGREPHWHDTVDSLPEAPLFVVANEFFDALPIRQFQRQGDVWREIVVGLADNGLQPGVGGPVTEPALISRMADTADGDIVETCAPARAVMATVSARIAQQGGAAIIVDYGDWQSLGDTFQAVRQHSHTDPFREPGKADLTAHVDFAALCDAVVPEVRCTKMTTQGVFLERLGITARAQALAAHATKTQGAAAAIRVAEAHKRLTHPDEMGSLFKVIGVVPAAAPPPAGLEL